MPWQGGIGKWELTSGKILVQSEVGHGGGGHGGDGGARGGDEHESA